MRGTGGSRVIASTSRWRRRWSTTSCSTRRCSARGWCGWSEAPSPVALTSLAVVAFVPTASGAAGGLALAGVAVALALSVVGAHHQALPLSAAALAVAVGASVDLGAGGEVHRWARARRVATRRTPRRPVTGPSARAVTRRPGAGWRGAGRARASAGLRPVARPGCSGCLPLPAVLGHRPEASWWVLVGGVVALAAPGGRPAHGTAARVPGCPVGAGCWALTGWREPRGVVVEAIQWALAIAVLVGRCPWPGRCRTGPGWRGSRRCSEPAAARRPALDGPG